MLNKILNLFKKNIPAGGDIDLSCGYYRLSEFKEYLKRQEYSDFEKAYEQLTWDAKTLLNEGIGLNKNLSNEVTNWVTSRPDSYIAHLFAGVSKQTMRGLPERQ